MKKTATVISCLCAFLLVGFQAETDEKEIKRFITEAVDARRMDREEGRLASQRGTTGEIRDYGELMVKDQNALLIEVKELAKIKKIALSEGISEEKSQALQNLKKVKANDFDQKFLQMIKIDHQRDVKEFKAALKYTDAQVRTFAKKHLPMIESHLNKVEKIDHSKSN